MLDSNDLDHIKGIVKEVVDASIAASEDRMDQKVKAIVLASEDRIVTRINREINDLAEINHAIMDKVSMLADSQQSMKVVEHKLGVA